MARLKPPLTAVARLLWLSYLVVAEPTKLCGTLDSRTAIVNNRLYFVSGTYTFDDDDAYHTENSMFSIDLSQNSTWDSPLPMSKVERHYLPSTDLSDGADVLSATVTGAFFYDKTMMYAYGAVLSSSNSSNSLWGYNTSDKSWKLHEISGGKIAFGDNSDGIFISDPGTARSWYTGGDKIGFNHSNNGLLRFEASQPTTPQWNFVTTQTGMQGPDIFKGTMQYLRKGKSGILVAFGGFNTTSRGTQFGLGWDYDFHNMSSIFVYDIFSSTWYLIEATGDIPPERAEMCTAVSSPGDDSSFQITMYGGFSLLYNEFFSDVYVLSIPAFKWIKIDARSDPDLRPNSKGQSGWGRTRHKCHIHRDRQMIVLGGYPKGNTKTSQCEDNYPPLKVLDTTTYNWVSSFSPEFDEYKVPTDVYQTIGGDASGGATTMEPEEGFSDELKSIFSQTVARDEDTPSNANPSTQPSSSPTDTPSTSPAESPKSISKGAIVGITVSCAVALACLIFAMVYRRRLLARSKVNRYASTREHFYRPAEVHEIDITHQELLGMRHLYTAELPSRGVLSEMPHWKEPVELYAGSRSLPRRKV